MTLMLLSKVICTSLVHLYAIAEYPAYMHGNDPTNRHFGESVMRYDFESAGCFVIRNKYYSR